MQSSMYLLSNECICWPKGRSGSEPCEIPMSLSVWTVRCWAEGRQVSSNRMWCRHWTKLWAITGRLLNDKDSINWSTWDKLKCFQFYVQFIGQNSHTWEWTPEVLREPLGVAEFGGDPMESLRGGLDFEYVRSDSEAVCLSTHGDGDVTLPFSECCRSFGLCPGNWSASSQAVFSWAWLLDNFIVSPPTKEKWNRWHIYEPTEILPWMVWTQTYH